MLDDDGVVGALRQERLRWLEDKRGVSSDVELALDNVVRRARRQRAGVRVTAIAAAALVAVTVIALAVRPTRAVPPTQQQDRPPPTVQVTPTATVASVDFVIGSWQTYVGPVQAHGRYGWLLGDRSLDVNSDGTVNLVGPPAVGTVDGRWTMRAGRLRLDISGRLHCSTPGLFKVGVPRLGAHTLLPLTVWSDQCTARRKVLVNEWHPLNY